MFVIRSFPSVGTVVACVALAVSLSSAGAGASDVRTNYRDELRNEGFMAETPEQIVSIYDTSERQFIRWRALGALDQVWGEKAIPTLGRALSDHRIEVRLFAAQLLRERGVVEKALARMRQDFEESMEKERRWARGEAVEEMIDGGITGRAYYQGLALETGLELAKLGDYRGYNLAAAFAFDADNLFLRGTSIRLLGEIAKAKADELAGACMYPMPALFALAAMEDNYSVFMTMIFVACGLKQVNDDRLSRAIAARKECPEDPMDHREELLKSIAITAQAGHTTQYLEADYQKEVERWARLQAKPPAALSVSPKRPFFGFVKPGDSATITLTITALADTTDLAVSAVEKEPTVEFVQRQADPKHWLVSVTWHRGAGQGVVSAVLHATALSGKDEVGDLDIVCFGLAARPGEG